jgi:2',3'-cyclic-nucleotide 2'-phosphodiesterase/3'-nucleotidase
MTVTATVGTGSPDRAGGDGELRLRLLATSDLHAHLLPFNYYADRRDDRVGLAGLAAQIEQARAECPNTLLFDNGDTLQGAPLGDAAVSGLMPDDAEHPMIAAMNGLGYDAATLGNHDFDFGLPALERALAAARYPVVLANARRPGVGGTYLPPYAILERAMIDEGGAVRALRVGVTGVTPPQVMQWGRAQLDGRIAVEPMLPAVTRTARRLRALGADLVVVLAHTGLGRADDPGEGENVGLLISAIDGVDAVVAGHTHCAHPVEGAPDPREGDAPVVQPGFFGSHLGQIDLTLRPVDSDAPLGWRVVAGRAGLRPAAESGEPARGLVRRRMRRMPAIRGEVARGHRLTRAYAGRVLGRGAVPLETYFSLCAPCAATQLIAEAQRTAVAPVLNQHPELRALPVLSCTTPFKAGGRGGPDFYTDVPAGPLLLRHAADLYIYPNGLSLLRASGAQVRTWLERSAAAFRQITPGGDGTGQPQPLLDLAFASYNFDRMDGLRYEVDVSTPALTNAEGHARPDGGGRIRNLRCSDGRAVQDDDGFVVITSAYRAAGGGHYPAASNCEVLHSSATPVREHLVAYIEGATEPIDPAVTPSWSFACLGGTEVVFETGPGARAHPDRAEALGLTFDGIGPTGFARYVMKI